MAEFEVYLPDLKEASGDSDAGNVAKVSFVYISDGDSVSEGESLIEMLTDKATFDVPSPKNGVVKSIVVEEDNAIEVNALLCVLEVEE